MEMLHRFSKERVCETNLPAFERITDFDMVPDEKSLATRGISMETGRWVANGLKWSC